ncbi:nuclear transcription factor Y subunit A-10-like [Macadamia integrifolia]|uniref:nuclear transcription factor Y subunit A-10-like n=1 Tax=Macadamia integrifolia TaxID=60698 RepID=UPI001C4F033A|nr:nuclear transcription factor Y subunit A-10-like [Macadamia integrifolia]
MQTISAKEHGRNFNNPIFQLSPVTSVPWWSAALGSQPVYPAPHKENSDGKDYVKAQKAQQFTSILSRQSSQPQYQASVELGLAQPMVCTNYPYIDQCYGVFTAYGAQTAGRMLLPLNMTTDDGPIYVNAKQYHGIIKRRQSRAKAEIENKAVKNRKPYLHESRHLHALRRARGCGGRFLKTKNPNSGKVGTNASKASEGKLSESNGSPSSEGLQSKSGNLNSSKKASGGGSNLSGSEVTSVYSGDLNQFQGEHLRLSTFRSLSNIMVSGQGVNMSNKWVAADGCCDLLKI